MVLQLLWYFSRAATELRFQFLAEQPIGGPSHAILLTDIPGVPSGTFVDTLSWVSLVDPSVAGKAHAWTGSMLGARLCPCLQATNCTCCKQTVASKVLQANCCKRTAASKLLCSSCTQSLGPLKQVAPCRCPCPGAGPHRPAAVAKLCQAASAAGLAAQLRGSGPCDQAGY
jgi:hypothetical protein